jgi:hypothetical protein
MPPLRTYLLRDTKVPFLDFRGSLFPFARIVFNESCLPHLFCTHSESEWHQPLH